MIRRIAIFGFILALAAGTCVLRAQVRGGVDFTRPGRGRVRLQAPSDGLRRNSRGLGAVRGASPSGTGTALQSSLRSNLSASRGLLRRGGGTGSGLDLGTDLLGTRPEGKTLYSGFADVPPLLAGAASDLMPGKLPSLRQGLGPAAKDTGMSSRLGTLAAAFAYVQAVDVASESLGYGDEVVGHAHLSWADPHKVREVVVVGSDKRIVFDDLAAPEQVRVFEKGVKAMAPEAPTYGEFNFLLRDGDIIIPKVEAGEPLKNECLHFVESLQNGHHPLTDGQNGLDVVRVMEAVERSLELRGAPVEVL